MMVKGFPCYEVTAVELVNRSNNIDNMDKSKVSALTPREQWVFRRVSLCRCYYNRVAHSHYNSTSASLKLRYEFEQLLRCTAGTNN